MIELDKNPKQEYKVFNEFTPKERELIFLVRSIESGKVTCCKEKGNITHFKIEQTKLA